MWKTFAGRCLYQSPQGTRVFQNLLFRWLQFDSKALQTVLNRYGRHKPGLNYIKYLIMAAELKPQNCCMFGLGGGGAAHALSPLLGDFQLTIIENSAEIIELAKRFFWLDQLKNIKIIHQDASEFLCESVIKFDHLLIDLFTANNFPSQCNNDQFFINCKKALTPEGILAVNVANIHEYKPLFQLIQKQFSHSTLVISVPGSANLIIMAQNSPSINPLLERLRKNRRFKQLSWTENWGYVAKIKR
jgi:spermidine synthase